jgi:hypothetical protein
MRQAIQPPPEYNIRRFDQEAGSPARLLDTRNQAAERQVPEADPANAKLAVKATGSPAQAAPVSMLHGELARGFRFDFLGLGRHKLLFLNPQKELGLLSLDSLLLSEPRHLEPSRPLKLPGSLELSVCLLPLGLRLAERQAELL